MHKEDILRAILEFELNNHGVKANVLLAESGGDLRLFERAIIEMEKNNLIKREGEKITLTSNGRKTAKKIYDKHRLIEEYFRELFNEPNVHILAHALEHCITDSVLAKMEGELALFTENFKLSDLEKGEQATIIAIAVSDQKLFSRLLGMGLSPRSKVKLFENLPSQLVIEVEGRKMAIDRFVADNIIVSKEESSKVG
jgi:Mn-dependent DtxR family transcriptional regulator/Fe2+ transport system protein FeoA